MICHSDPIVETWNCRILVAPNHDFYIPFTLPVWGIVEHDHVHIDNHLNFIFHAMPYEGTLMAATAYPLRDTFQYVRVGSIVGIHGVVKWFTSHSFQDFYADTSLVTGKDEDPLYIIIFMWSLIAFGTTLTILMYVYRNYLKPKILRRVLKND